MPVISTAPAKLTDALDSVACEFGLADHAYDPTSAAWALFASEAARLLTARVELRNAATTLKREMAAYLADETAHLPQRALADHDRVQGDVRATRNGLQQLAAVITGQVSA
jgi:hypothetical protein